MEFIQRSVTKRAYRVNPKN